MIGWHTVREELYILNYDLVKSIENYQKAISLNHGSQLPCLLRSLLGSIFRCWIYRKS